MFHSILRLAAWLTLLCLFPSSVITAPLPQGTDLGTLWDTAMNAFNAGDPHEAAKQFTGWIEEGERRGVSSSEAFYNLGLAEWAAREPGKAALHLAESARLRASPVSALKALNTLTEVEREIGVQDPVSESVTFRLCYVMNREWLVALCSLAFWLAATAVLLRWLRGKKAPIGPLVLGSLGLIAVVTVGAVNRRYFGSYGVLLPESGEVIPLYRDAERVETRKLADLPPGMVVATGPDAVTATELYRPVSGWVPSPTVRRLTH